MTALSLAFSSAHFAFAGETESNTFFARGRELRIAGNCKDAIEQFRKAYDSYPEGLGAIRNIAECEEELKRPASARRSWWSLRTAAKELQSEKYNGWDKDAEEAFARLAPQVATLVVRVKNTGAEPRVLLNGRPLTPSLLGTELEQDLGEMEIVLDDGSAVPNTKKLQLESGKRYEVELIGSGSTKSNLNVVNPPGESTKDTPPPTGPSPLIIGGGVGLGLAGLGLGGLIGAVVVRQSALSTIEDACPSLTNCDPSLKEEEDRGATASTLFTAFAIGGGVAAAAGVGLLIAGFVTGSSTSSSKPTATSVRVDFAPSPEGLGAVLTSTF